MEQINKSFMQDSPELMQILGKLHQGRVVCLGDIMLDRYVYGSVKRISAEAPIPIINTNQHIAMLGGVGNVAYNIATAGGKVYLISIHGDDTAGLEVARKVADVDNIKSGLVTELDRLTTVKTRYIASGQQLLRADNETIQPISDASGHQLMVKLDDALRDTDILIISDYGKGVLSDKILVAAIKKANSAKIPIIVDPKRTDLSLYAGADFLKPNRMELANATGMTCGSDAEVAAAASTVIQKYNIQNILVSRSEQGMSLISKNAEPLHLQIRAPEVFDVSGAGDTVVAIFALAQAIGADRRPAASLANLAGAIVVGKIGTAAVSKDELASKILAADLSSSEDKIVSAYIANLEIKRWQNQNLRVGFTNGCFDLLHPGHISLLNEAKKSCDKLIVAINTDASVKRLEKGEGRPAQSEAARALVLASLAIIDLVIIYDEDTPVPLLEQLHPDVLIKGGDYDLDGVVGADIVRGYGGNVKLAKYIEGHSSTDTIQRIGNKIRNKAEPNHGD